MRGNERVTQIICPGYDQAATMAPGRERMQTTSGFASAIDGPMLNVASLCCRRIELTQLVWSAACGRRRFIGWDPRRFATTAKKHRRSAANAGVSLYRI